MIDLESIINDKNANDEQWKKDREAERDYVVTTRDGGIKNVTDDPDLYGAYLALQGDNPTYSAGNIVLCLYQMENPTTIGTVEKWKGMGRYVKAEQREKGAKIFVRPSNPNIRGYSVGYAYDLSQTDGKPVAQTKLEDDSPRMEKAFTELLKFSPVKVESGKDMDTPAYYSDKDMLLYVNPGFSDSETFAALATETALARMHGKGYNGYYNREECFLAADSVSYMICRRFGIERDLPDASNLANLYEGLSVESRTSALDNMQDMAKQIGGGIERGLGAQQRSVGRGAARPVRAGR